MRSDSGFRPKLWPTLIALPTLLALTGLGIWQLERRDWKHWLMARVEDRLAAPVMTLPGPNADPDAIEFRRTAAVGDFLHDREMYLGGRAMAGQAGYHVLTPLRLDGGGFLLIDRGWVPFERRKPGQRPKGLIPGPVAVYGMIRRPAPPDWATPDNQPEKNDWYSIDIKAMAVHAGLDPANMRPFYVMADDTPNPGGLPVGRPARIDLPDNHLQYALTWFALALVLLVIYVLYHRGRKPEQGPE